MTQPHESHVIAVDPTGQLRCLYDDSLRPLLDLGESHIARASHIEPDEHGDWWADLSPVNGPRLGPYRARSNALAAETTWIEANYL